MKRALILAGIVLFAINGQVLAEDQNDEHRYSVGLRGGYINYQDRYFDDVGININEANNWIGGIEGNILLKDKVYFSPTLEYTTEKLKSSTTLTMMPLLLNFKAIFDIKYIRPFVGGGVGIYFIDANPKFKDRLNRKIFDSERAIGMQAFIGFEFDFTKKIIIFSELDIRFFESRRIFSVLNYPFYVGVRYKF